ncbi:Uncharacterised protein [Klebsiella pneumoniae]|nr:Uncharacterised protein [Klebsiella pneumoniae]
MGQFCIILLCFMTPQANGIIHRVLLKMKGVLCVAHRLIISAGCHVMFIGFLVKRHAFPRGFWQTFFS